MGNYGPATREVTIGVSAGLCPSCSAKSIAYGEKGYRKYMIVSAVFWIISIALFSMMTRYFYLGTVMMLLAFIIGILSMVPFRRALAKRTIKKDRFWQYIDITGNRLEDMLFSFSNKEYAEAFKNSNEALKSEYSAIVKPGKPIGMYGCGYWFGSCCYGFLLTFILLIIGGAIGLLIGIFNH